MCMIRDVDEILSHHGTGPENTIGILQDIQNHFRYLPLEALDHVCKNTEISPSQIYGVATFYAQFRMDPVGEHIIRVCHGTACHVKGSETIAKGRWASRMKAPPETDQASKLSLVCGMLPAQKPMMPTGRAGSSKSSRQPSTISFMRTR